MDISWRRKFLWSKERQREWDFCLRSYYYRYLAEWENHPQKELIQKLNKLLTWEEYKKNIFMDLIEKVIQKKEKQELKEYLEDKLYQIFNAPDEVLIRREETGALSLEDAVREIEELFKNFISILESYFRNRYFYKLEKRYYYHGIPVLIKPDFISISDKGVEILKVEISHPSFDDLLYLESGVIILWALEEYNLELDKVKINIVDLKECQQEVLDISFEKLLGFGREIISRAQQMLLVQKIEDLFPSPEEVKCKVCRFHSLCPDSLYKI